MNDANGPPGSSWMIPNTNVPSTSSGVVAARPQTSSSSAYHLRPTTNPKNSPGYDSNNNSSTCTNHERDSIQRYRQDEIAELAKTIGNEFRGEFIVLPHHLVNFDQGDPVDLSTGNAEDDLSSNSEDCVYAYRGDEQHPIAVDGVENMFPAAVGDELQDDDDETDFLEMDFDPNSEQDTNTGALNNFRRSGSELNAEEIPQVNRSSLLEQSKTINEWRERNEPQPGCSRAAFQLPVADADEEDNADDDLIDNGAEQDLLLLDDEDCFADDSFDNDYFDEHLKRGENHVSLSDAVPVVVPLVTGTKPKVKHPPATSSTRTTTPINISNNISHHVPQSPCNATEVPVLDEEEFSCLECSEMELPTAGSSKQASTSTTKGVCRRHCKKLRNNETEPTTAQLIVEDSQQIQICPNILDEEAAFRSFRCLGIELDRNLLHDQMENYRVTLERQRTITEYLIYYSKANCDSRRFVKIIEKCCPVGVFSELEFNVRNSGQMFKNCRLF